MKRNIIVAKNALSPQLCEQIINLQKNEYLSKGSVGDGSVNKEVRNSEVCFLYGSVKYFDIYKNIIDLVNKVNDEFYKFDLVEPETFQLTKYDEKNQGFYKPHEDGFYDNTDNHTVRKLSMSAQLTSPEYYEGGELEFPNDKEKFIYEDAKEQGTVVFFPSYLKHGVQPVTKGIRYSLVSWFLGPNFR
jgi:PKHD-type hydroxylase